MAYEKYYAHKRWLEQEVETQDDPKKREMLEVALKHLPADFVVRFGKDSLPTT